MEIKPIRRVSKKETDLTRSEEASYELEAQKLKNLSFKQDMDERKVYAKRTFRLIAFWIGGIFALLILNGQKIYLAPDYSFSIQLSENVMLAVIGGTTLNILGVFIFVMKYLFDPKGKE